MPFLKLAWRNLLRNPRRTSLTLAVIALGVAALVFAWSVFDGGNNQSINTMTGTFTGHVQVHAKGYTDDPSLDLTFGAAEAGADKLRAVPGVRALAPRLQAPVMISTDAMSRGVLLVGVDPAKEREVTNLHERLSAGSWLGEQSGGIVIGNTLAKALKLAPGGEVAVLTQGLHGSIGAARYKVVGIYATGNEMVDGLQAFISLQDADALLSAEGRLTTLAMKLEHYDRSAGAVAAMRALMPAALEVEGWQQLLPDVAQKVNFHEWVATIVMLLMFGVVLVGVTNTVLMSTLERMREFGISLAIGTQPMQLFRQIVAEGALLGLIGFAIGLAIGGGAVAHFHSVGIDFGAQSGALQQMPGLASKLYPYLSLKRALMLGAGVALITVGAAVYPAVKTARLAPLVAMRGLAGLATGTGGGGSSSQQGLVPLLALRNIGRHPMRNMLTGFGMMFAIGAFVFLGCFVTGYYRQIVENSTGFVTGDGQIQHSEYKARLDASLALDDGPALLKRVAALPEVRASSARVQTPGLVSSPKSAEPVQLLGVDPDAEKTVTFLYKSVRQGRYLSAGADHEVVIGRKLAERLAVSVGEKVVVMAQDAKGALASEAFVVVGLFDTGSHSFDETMAQVSLPSLQRMLGLQGRYTTIAFRSRDSGEPAAAVAAVKRLQLPAQASVYTWQELIPEVVQMNTMFKGSLLLVMVVVFATIALVVMNTVLMSVLERTREFGTMLALGSPPRLIIGMVVLESLTVGALGSLVGTSLGTLAAWGHSITGMSMKSHSMTAIPGTTDIVFPQLSWAATLQPGLLMPLIVIGVSLLPAWRASRLDPVQAMRSG